MSAINLFVHPDRVDILTDGLARGADGAALLHSKVTPITHLDAAVAAMGHAYVAQAFGTLCAFGKRTFDQLVDELPDCLRLAAQIGRVQIEATGIEAPPAEVLAGYCIAAGWSERHERFEGYAIWPESLDHWGKPETPTLLNNHRSPFVWRGLQPETKAAMAAEGIDPDSPEATAEGVGMEVLRLQREEVADHPHFTGRYIGGFAELTTIRRGCIKSRILERWPEDVLQPEAA